MKLVAWGLTDVGRKRDHNEDALLIDLQQGLFAVAEVMVGPSLTPLMQISRLAVSVALPSLRV